MKRFWTEAAVAAAGDGFGVQLDGRGVHLPGGALLVVPFLPLADAIAAEWRAAGGGPGGEMSFADTPLTRLAGTVQERIAPDPAPAIAAIAAYGGTDLLCYRAERPGALVSRQARLWQPWLDWAALTHDAPLRVTAGIVHVRQDEQALAALRRAVAALGPWKLGGLGVAVPALGSLVLGLALAERRLSAAEAHETAMLDALFEVEQWGDDAEAAARRAGVGDDIAVAARFMEMCGS